MCKKYCLCNYFRCEVPLRRDCAYLEDCAITPLSANPLFRCVHASLYMRVCPSVRLSVRPSVRGPSVPRFFRIAEIDKKQHRIIGKVETLFLDCNNLQKNFKTKF